MESQLLLIVLMTNNANQMDTASRIFGKSKGTSRLMLRNNDNYRHLMVMAGLKGGPSPYIIVEMMSSHIDIYTILGLRNAATLYAVHNTASQPKSYSITRVHVFSMQLHLQVTCLTLS